MAMDATVAPAVAQKPSNGFRNLRWLVCNPTSSVSVLVDGVDVALAENERGSTSGVTDDTLTIYYSHDRYSSLDDMAVTYLRHQVSTVGDVLDRVFEFYNTRPMDEAELLQVAGTNDCWGYSEAARQAADAAKIAREQGAVPTPTFLVRFMGDSVFFEGFCLFKGGWNLQLGS